MASSSSKISGIGVIVEDRTDFDAIRILICKTVSVDGVAFKSKVGNGCSKIKSKCVAWSRDLSNRKCNILIVVHDLDRNDYTVLHNDLSKKLSTGAIENHFIAIPVEELEAWFAADPAGIKQALNLAREPKFKGNPETIQSPKEKLRDEIFRCSNKEIAYQTSMNPRIAESVDTAVIATKCPSFKSFVAYLEKEIGR